MHGTDDMTRRGFLKAGAAILGVAALGGHISPSASQAAVKNTGKAKVWYCPDITPDTLLRVYDKVCGGISGRVAIKLHTGEPGAPNLPPRELSRALVEHIPHASIVECNVLYPGPRFTTEGHRKLLAENGWTFTSVDIMDEDGDVALPVPGAREFFDETWGKPGVTGPFTPGNHLREVHVGKHLLNYDSLVVFTHFKGHSSGGYGGSLKNIAIGCASPRGKREQHGDGWIRGELFQEHMVEAAKAVVGHFAPRICYINLLMNMSVDCDCAGTKAARPKCPNLGILASTDLASVERASVDMVYAMPEQYRRALVERIESRKGLRQLEFMKIFGMGDGAYELARI